MTGKVYLVGAGPGKSDLITVRGLEVLRQADVIIYVDVNRDSDHLRIYSIPHFE